VRIIPLPYLTLTLSYVELANVARKMQPLPPEERDAIKKECAADGETHQRSSGTITCTLGATQYFVKYGISKALTNRVKTQPFLFDAKPQSIHKPRIPRLLDHFDDDEGKTYAVIEYINIKIPAPSDDLNTRVENTLRWLSEVSAPPDHVFGPLGGGCILHDFFSFNEGEAPLAFKNVKALERYMKKVCVFNG